MKKFLAMTLAITTLILSLAVFTVSADPVSYEIAGNLLQNGSFENPTGLAGTWGGSGTYWSQQSHTGGYGASFEIGSASYGLQQSVTLEKGKTYVVSAWIRLSNTETVNATTGNQIQFSFGNGTTGVATELSVRTQWSSGLGVTLEEGVWKQVAYTFNTNNQTAETADYMFQVLGEKIRVIFDDVFVGEAILGADMAIGGVSIRNNQDAGAVFTWDRDSLHIDYSKVSGSGYNDNGIKISYGFLNQVGTTHGVEMTAEEWAKMTFTPSYVSGSSDALRGFTTSTPGVIVPILAPNSGGRDLKDCTLTITYAGDTTITKTLDITFSTDKLEATLSNGTTIIGEGDALAVGEWTPTFNLYNKKLGYFQFIAIAVLYNGNTVEDIVISNDGHVKDQNWGNSLYTVTANDTLTITDTTNRTVKFFVWARGNGTSTPHWNIMQPKIDTVVIG